MTLEAFFDDHPRVAIGFSGGVDSAYLLYAAMRWGRGCKAYYVKTAFQPAFELEDAIRLAEELNAPMEIIHLDVLSDSQVCANPKDRCYHCKKVLFSALCDAAGRDGFDLIVDGTNASDDASDRPGIRALRELSVRSPLQECGLTKAQIRRLSAQAGLFTHDKPAYACLATRIPTGECITREKLTRTEQAETFLTSLGFRNFRVRTMGECARLQVAAGDFAKVALYRDIIMKELKRYYTSVLLDLEVRNEQ